MKVYKQCHICKKVCEQCEFSYNQWYKRPYNPRCKNCLKKHPVTPEYSNLHYNVSIPWSLYTDMLSTELQLNITIENLKKEIDELKNKTTKYQ